ncbi:MAG: hypothetical protein J6A83_03920 [Clostridia bacterium]|nr:hypothetical protein [Clostridia bacterium]
MTIRPAMKNLFSSKKSAIGMLCVMLILQTLLSVICITGVENIKTQNNILKDHNANLALYSESEEKTEAPVTDASDSELTDSAASDEGRLVPSEVNSALNGIPIFGGFLCLWIITAIIVYQRISSASADRDKYMWGMYITYGAQRKKVRNILKYELYSVLAVATIPSYFLALKLCNFLVSKQGYQYSFEVIPFLLVLLFSYICIRLVVAYEVKLIGRRSCTELLKEEEGPSKLCRPRRTGILRKGFSPLRYAATSFMRLRKYYVMLALAAAIPAIIWICCQTAAYSQNQYLSSDIKEYKITIKNGITENDLKKVYFKNLCEIQGVSSVTSSAIYPADEISMFMLADRSQYKDESASILHGYDVYADGDAVLACCSQAFKNKTGLSMKVPRGKVTVILPNDDTSYSFEEGETLCVAVSRLDGKIRTDIVDVNTAIEQDLSEEYEYELFTIDKVTSLRRTFASSSFINVEQPYFLFNEADFEKITSLSPNYFSHDINDAQISFDPSVKEDGSIDLVIGKSDLAVLPKKGDTIQLRGSASYNITLRTQDGETLNNCLQLTFNLLNVNSVSVSDNQVNINASPRVSAVMKYDMVEPTVIFFGLPEQIPSDAENSIYLPHDTEDGAIRVYDSTVTLDFSESVIFTDPTVRAADAGTHLKLGGANISAQTKEKKLLLENLYGNNLFDIVCGDSTTTEALGIDVTVTESGKAAIILPEKYLYDFDLAIGDIIRINKTEFDVSQYESDNWQLKDPKERLSEIIGKSFEYQRFEITEIIYSDEAKRPQVIICGEDFASAMNIAAPYTQLNVFLDNSVDSERYAAINDSLTYELQKISLLSSNASSANIVSNGAFLDFLLKKNANHGLWISVIGTLIPLTLPFIWYYPLATLFERRRHDYITLKNLGKKKSKIRAIFFLEGLMVALTALIAIALLCYPCMLAFDLVCFLFELPIDFNVSFLTPATFISACAAGLFCVALSFVICYFIAAPKKPKIKKTKKQKGEG